MNTKYDIQPMIIEIKKTCFSKRKAINHAENILFKARRNNPWDHTFHNDGSTQEEYAAQEVLEHIEKSSVFEYGWLRFFRFSRFKQLASQLS